MSKQKWYSPQLERALVRALYFEAKARNIPMTKLANHLIKAALRDKQLDLPRPNRFSRSMDRKTVRID